jgi:hypothetical protein
MKVLAAKPLSPGVSGVHMRLDLGSFDSVDPLATDHFCEGLRHVGMHAARDVGQGFSIPILGVHTYTWALFIYWVCIVTMGVLLMLLKEGEAESTPRRLRALGFFLRSRLSGLGGLGRLRLDQAQNCLCYANITRK